MGVFERSGIHTHCLIRRGCKAWVTLQDLVTIHSPAPLHLLVRHNQKFGVATSQEIQLQVLHILLCFHPNKLCNLLQ